MNERDNLPIKRIKTELDYIGSKFNDVSKESFLSDEDMQRIAAMALINIGECVNRLSDSFKEKYPHIPWHEVVALRNISAHGYWDLKMEIVWETLINDIPILKDFFKTI